ncbi:MAG: PAS domain-containing protein [Thermoleophilaceae bacterium]|nr:PAS domain-containing protein [Thermoleophilaceae bacterium]
MSQKPIELILARNLLSSLTTPAFLVDDHGALVFYNDAAATLVGRRFEERGQMAASDWTEQFGPADPEGRPVSWEDLPLTKALFAGRAIHSKMHLKVLDGTVHEIEVSALPIFATGGTRGAMAIFWPVEDGPQAGGPK